VLLLDKTGTITLGNRQAFELMPAPGIGLPALADASQLASLADETPEGRSIVVLAKEKYGLRGRNIHELNATFIPFSAQTRMSGGAPPPPFPSPASGEGEMRRIRKGAAEAIEAFVHQQGGTVPPDVRRAVEDIAKRGGTPLVVAEGPRAL